MNPKTVKDSESLVTSPFEDFNKSLKEGGKPVTKDKKKDSETMPKTPAPGTPATGNAFEQFNSDIKKKDSGGPELPAEGSQEASTSTSSGKLSPYPAIAGMPLPPMEFSGYFSKKPEVSRIPEEIRIKNELKKTLEDAEAFIRTDYQNNKPQRSPYLPKEDPNSGEMPEELQVINFPAKLSSFVNDRTLAINKSISDLTREMNNLVRKRQAYRGGELEAPGPGEKARGVEIIRNPEKYAELEGQINQQKKYLQDLQRYTTELVANNLVREELRNPNAQHSIGIPRDLGRKIVKYADKLTNDQYSALEEKGKPLGGIPSADMERAGLEAWKKFLILNEDIPNREAKIKDLMAYEDEYDEKNFELTNARILHKIGAKLKEKSGFGSSIFRRQPSINQIIEAAKESNLTPSEEKVFNSYTLPNERANIGTDIPMSGFVNKFGEAIGNNVTGLSNIFRGDTDRIYEALNQEANTQYDEVGEFGRDKKELETLKLKEKTNQGVTAEEKDRIKELENYTDVRRWYDKFWDGAGDLTGQVAYQAGLARMFGGVGNLAAKAPVVGGLISKGTTMLGGRDAINLMMSSFATSYDNHAKEAAMLMPRSDQALQRRMYAYTMSAVEGLSESIFKDTKVLDAFKKNVSPDVVKLSQRLSAKEISEEAAKSRLQQILTNRLKPFAKEFAKAEFQESTEEAVVDVAKGLADTIFAGKEFNAEETFGNAANTFLTTMAYSPFVSGMAAVKDVRSSALGKSGIYKMATNPEVFRREIQRQVDEGMPQNEADQKLQVINTASEIAKQLPVKKSLDAKKNPEITAINDQWKQNIRDIGERTDISDAEKESLKEAEDLRHIKELDAYMKKQGDINSIAMDYPDRVNYLTHRLNEVLLEDKMSKTNDDIIKEDLQKQIDRSKKIREGIYNGTIITGNNLDLITADEELADELDITPLAEADEDTLPINISKPKKEEDESNKRSTAEKQQAGSESSEGEHSGQENSGQEQTLPEEHGPLENESSTEEGSDKPTLPPGMTQEQFNKLPDSIKEKLLKKAASDPDQVSFKTQAGKSLVGKKVTIPGYEELDLVMVDNGLEKDVYELASGLKVADTGGAFSEGDAISAIRDAMLENKITPDKIFKKLKDSEGTIPVKNPVKAVNESPGYAAYKERKTDEYSKLPDRYTSEEKTKYQQLLDEANEKSLTVSARAAEGQINLKVAKGMELSPEAIREIMDREEKDKQISEIKKENKPLDAADIKERSNDFESYKNSVNNVYKSDQFSKLPEDVQQTGYDAFKKQIDIYNKFGYWPAEMKDLKQSIEISLQRYISAINSRSAGRDRINTAINDLANTVEKLDELHDRLIKGKTPTKKAAPVKDADQFTAQELDAINKIRSKDLSKTGLGSYASVLNDENSTPDEKKAALKGISDQLTDPETEETTGSVLGSKLSDAIYDLNYAPVENKNITGRMQDVATTNEFEEVDGKVVAKKKSNVENELPIKSDTVYDTPLLKDPKTGNIYYVPRRIQEAAYENDKENQGRQSLDRIIQRGGYGLNELDKLLPNWRSLLPVQKQSPAPASTTADVSFVPLDQISTDVARFQPRGTDFSPESVNKIVNDYDQNKLDPVVLYRDSDGNQYVLAGHSRFEAHNRLNELPDSDPVKQRAIENGYQPGQIKARYFTGTEKEAIEFADRSNDLGTKNKDYESAASLRRMRESGDTKTAIKDRAQTDFGKNWRYIYTLSHLNPNGKIIQTLQQFDNNPDKEAQNNIEKAAQWIGAARERFGDLLTNQHENEMFDFLMDKGRSTKLARENDFISLLQNIVGSTFYNPNEPLNLNRIKSKSAAELNYDTEEADIKQDIKDKQKELDDLNDRFNNPQNPQYVNPNSPDYVAVQKIAEQKKTKLNQELTALRKELVDHQQDKGKVISSGLAQPGLFDVNNLSSEEVGQLNEELKSDGISVDNIKSYEEDIRHITEVSQEDSSQHGQVETATEDIRESTNDQSASPQQDSGSATVSGQERTSSTVEPLEQSPEDKTLLEKKAKLEQAKKDFKEALRKSSGRLNASIIPIDPEVIANGVKLIGAYADLGIYRFKQIVSDIADTLGADFLSRENVDALKGVYSYYRSNQPKDQRNDFDSEDTVDDFLENELQAYTSPSNNQTEEQYLTGAVDESVTPDEKEFYQEELDTLRSDPFKYYADLYLAYIYTDPNSERVEDAWKELKPMIYFRDNAFVNKEDANDVVYAGGMVNDKNVELYGKNYLNSYYHNKVMSVPDFLESYQIDNRPESQPRRLSDFRKGDYIKDIYLQDRVYQVDSFKKDKYKLNTPNGLPEELYDNDTRWISASPNEFLDKQNRKKSGTSTASDLESDSARTAIANEMGQGELFPLDRGSNIQYGEDEPQIIHDIRPAGSPSLFPLDATIVGTPSDSQLPIEEQLTGLETSPAGNPDSGRGDSMDEAGIPPDPGAGESVERIADNLTGPTIAEKIELQKQAEDIPVIDMDIDNIRETLPFLMKEQQEDVYKAERRFIGEADNVDKLYGKGMLFTNGTGTGKTLTGLGIAKRMIKRGKKNGLIIVPSDVKAKDWIAEGQDYMQIPIYQLGTTQDRGQMDGANITTYANFRENPHLRARQWDWVIYDESHKINSNGAGSYTSAEEAHKYITSSPRNARAKAKVAINYDARSLEIRNRQDQLPRNERSSAEQTALDLELSKETVNQFKKTNVVFLSATPFAYHPNLTYADGYLFQITEEFDPQYGTDSYNNFYIQNFGYRIRYNKLTKPESGVDVDLLERQFTEGLKGQGVVVSRKLNVDKDYSRQFVIADDELGQQIDDGMSVLSNHEEFPYLSMYIHRHFNFLYKNQMMEAIKAKWAVDRIKKHLDLGRKVVVSHTYIENEPMHPFDFGAGDVLSPMDDNYGRVRDEIAHFHEKYPQYRSLDLRSLQSPIQTITKAFGDRVVLFNGRESKKDRNAAKKLFNTDDSGKDIMMVQMDAGKEGISLHDKTGKHQRALINLGLPYKPTDAIQIEGRIYRTGQKTDAVIEYPILNLNFERFAYANKINERVRTAENFALGEEARNMETAFKEGYINAGMDEPSLEQGKGGKVEDSRLDNTNEFKKSLTYYYKRGKRTAADKRGVTGDYYATPEPLGMKMVEWLGLVPNEKGLEPSAGHGAIARFFPRTTKNMFIEPNDKLRSETAINVFGNTLAGNFEDLNIINKFDGIAMNPPFGRAGKLAMEHLEKALGHLHDGGRVVALVPTGQMNNRLNDWQDSKDSDGFYITAKIQLPSVVFERAGTQVSTQIVVIDKVLDDDKVKRLPQQRNIDLSGYQDIKEFFNAIEDLSLPARIDPGQYAEETISESQPETETTTPGLPPQSNDLAEVVKAFHAKAQKDIYVVKLKKQISSEDFKNAAAEAKNMGGYWSSYKGQGAVPGFQFDTQEQADKFQSAITGKEIPEAEKMSIADRIRTWKIANTGKNLYSTIIPGGPQIWNAAVEIVASAVEAGGALVDSLKKGRDYIEQNWKKSWQKAKYNEEMMMELKSRGTLTYDLSPTQRAEADAAIARIQRTGKLIQEINELREGFDIAKQSLTDPADIKDLEDAYNEFERYLFDGLAAQEIEKMEGFHLGLADQTWFQKVKENWQNKFQRIEQVQKEIEKSGLTIEEKNDMVNRADRWKSIAAAKIDNVLREVGLSDVDIFAWKGRKKVEDSLFDQMAKDGVDYRKFNLYMYAKHAPERNAHNAKLRRENFAKKVAQIENDIQKLKDEYILNPSPTMKGVITRKENELTAYNEYEKAYNNPDTNKNYLKLLEKKIDRKFILMDDGGSGMTNAQADEILQEVENEGNTVLFSTYEDSFRDKVISKGLDLQKEYGLIDDTNYEYMSKYYENYVPLKVDDKYFEQGQTFTDSNIPGARIYKSKGANYHTFENRVNPITQSVIDLQATIYEGEQNLYKQTVAETIKTAPDNDIWELKPATYVPIKDKQGKVVGMDETNPPPNGIPYFDNGQKKYLVINDKALFEAMTGANVKNAIPILSKINSFFRSIYTLYNPAFTVSNLFRDVETAGIVLSATQKGDVAGKYRSNIKKIFSIMRGSFQQQGGADKTYWQQRAKEYKDGGGNMTWFQQETAQDQINDIEDAYKKYEKTGTFEAGKNLAVNIADFISKANTAVENSTRLAIYDAMLQSGVPNYKAIEIARNATINFQKKGNYGAMVDSLYLFFNASVQGTTNVLKSLLTTKRGLKLAGGIIMAGLLVEMYNNMMSDCGPDADPADCYGNIPDYEKERNIILKIPGGRGFLKIPLAWGFNVFYNVGEQIGEGINGNTTLPKAAAFLTKSAFNSFNPTGSSDQPLLQHISPTATDPIVQWWTNKDAFGRPIYNDFEFDRRPDSQRGFASDSKNAKDLAAWLNKQTGGNEKVKGKIDVAPGTLDWLYETATGGMGQFTSQAAGSAWDAVDPNRDVDLRRVPILNRFYTAPRERSNKTYIYNTVDDSYNTLMNPDEIATLKTELDKAVRLGDIGKKKADEYNRKVAKNQYELHNQDLFSIIDASKTRKLEQYEIDNFVGELERRANAGEMPSEWIRTYKATITRNQNEQD